MEKAIPTIQAKFTLKSFSVSLVNNYDSNHGIELYSRNFAINFKKFDDEYT